MNSERSRQVRRELWEEDQRCKKCGVLTILPSTLSKHQQHYGPYPHNMATIQHKIHKWDIKRFFYERLDPEIIELYCWKCNQDDGHSSEIFKEVGKAIEEEKKFSLIKMFFKNDTTK